MTHQEIQQLLRDHGFRATKARIAVISFLVEKPHPIGIEVIQRTVPEVNASTLYRMMQDFVEKGLVDIHDLGHGHADYEFALREHHHHIVCTDCGKIEDIACEKTHVRESLKGSTFSQVTDHDFRYQGICADCCK